MTKEDFAEKWGYQTSKEYGSAKFDCKKLLLEDLELVIEKIIKHECTKKFDGNVYGDYCKDRKCDTCIHLK
jgi:hypothetical protein